MRHNPSLSVIPVGHAGLRLRIADLAHAAARALHALGHRLASR